MSKSDGTSLGKNSKTELLAQFLGLSTNHLHFINKNQAIHQEMVNAFNQLTRHAKQDNIELTIASAYRSFDRQLLIWNNKFSGKTSILDSRNNIVDISKMSAIDIVHAIMQYSALPGTSRHHWGCDIDVYAANLIDENYQLKLEPWEYEKQGPMAALTSWLDEHAQQYGFYRPYAEYQGGVAVEPWHLSYQPIAKTYQQAYSLEALANCLKQSDILAKQAILDNLTALVSRYVVLD